MQEHLISLEDKPSDADCRFLGDSLYKFNVSKTGLEGKPITVFLRDAEKNIIGGTMGWTALDCLHINVLWVREDVRGQGYGRRLLLTAEQEAIKRSCRRANLDTFSFQAPGFYEKLGYRVFGQIDGLAGNSIWYFLIKDLA
jgi:GNAT superfamily N-acetyltransferase